MLWSVACLVCMVRVCSVSVCGLQTTEMKHQEIEKMRETLMKAMDVNLGDLKKMLEKQKIMEEQERMRKIQVREM